VKIAEVEDLARELAAGRGAPIALVAGGDDAVRDGVVRVLADRMREGGAAVSVVRLDAEPARTDAWSRLAETASAVPLFGEAFVLAVSGCDAAKAPAELKAFLDSPAPHVGLALFADRKAAKSGLARAVAAVGHVLAPADLREAAAVRVATELAREAGLRMDQRAASALVDMVGSDRAALAGAIESLAEYKGKGGAVVEEDLRGLVTRTRKAAPWDMDEAVGARDLAKAVRLASREIQDSPDRLLRVFNGVVRHARQMLSAKGLVARHETDAKAMEELKIGFDFQWRRLRDAAARYSREELAAFLRDVPRLETQAKRGYASDEAFITHVLARLIGNG